jgi:hypothetical protein
MLLDHGASLSAKDLKNRNRTTLHTVSGAGQSAAALIQVLPGYGADANARRKSNQTPLPNRDRVENEGVAWSVLEYGTDANAHWKNNDTCCARIVHERMLKAKTKNKASSTGLNAPKDKFSLHVRHTYDTPIQYRHRPQEETSEPTTVVEFLLKSLLVPDKSPAIAERRRFWILPTKPPYKNSNAQETLWSLNHYPKVEVSPKGPAECRENQNHRGGYPTPGIIHFVPAASSQPRIEDYAPVASVRATSFSFTHPACLTGSLTAGGA